MSKNKSLPQACGTCFFWEKNPHHTPGGSGVLYMPGPEGECRRYPPKKREHNSTTFYPTPRAGMWCGEWKGK